MKREKLVRPRFLLDGEKLRAEECKYNSRAKFIPNPDGTLKLYEEMYCNRYIFNPEGVEEFNREHRLRRERWEADLLEMYGREPMATFTRTAEDNLQRSKRRAKRKLFDYILCNEFKYFCTLTLNGDLIDRNDYGAIMKKLKNFLDNRVRRNGLFYVGVPELHKNGGIHFHFLTNGVINVVDSGTVIRPNGGRPVKTETAIRQGFDLGDCRPVYNIPDWKLGFTTAIEIYGNREAVANYIGKYITKGDSKIGGRWYYSGGALKTPIYTYERVNFADCVGDYGFSNEGGIFLIKKF